MLNGGDYWLFIQPSILCHPYREDVGWVIPTSQVLQALTKSTLVTCQCCQPCQMGCFQISKSGGLLRDKSGQILRVGLKFVLPTFFVRVTKTDEGYSAFLCFS